MTTNVGIIFYFEAISQEDLLLLSQVEGGIGQKEDGHYELPLPFKMDKPHLPDNKLHAVQRQAEEK